jgi:cytidine deaminase
MSYEELSESELNLIHKALGARDRSHSPYSNFQVGAAALLSNGEIVLGANQENAAYPSGLCAERVALFSAAIQFPKEQVKLLAVCVPDDAAGLPFPCGSCLQVAAEYEFKQEEHIKLFLIQPVNQVVYLAKSVKHLLPFSFNKSHLQD